MSDIEKLAPGEKEQLRDMILAVSNTGLPSGPGLVVMTKGGRWGRTYHRDNPVRGKQIVYIEGKPFLCDPSTLTLKGFID